MKYDLELKKKFNFHIIFNPLISLAYICLIQKTETIGGCSITPFYESTSAWKPIYYLQALLKNDPERHHVFVTDKTERSSIFSLCACKYHLLYSTVLTSRLNSPGSPKKFPMAALSSRSSACNHSATSPGVERSRSRSCRNLMPSFGLLLNLKYE